MALSEREEALLQQMEEALYAEDPRFASRIEKHKRASLHRGRLAIAVLAALGGLGLIIAAASLSQIWLGAIGFAAMVAGIAVGLTPARRTLTVVEDSDSSPAASPAEGAKAPRTIRRGGAGSGSGPRQTKPSGSTGTFMQRMEQRWEKRKRDQW